MSEQQNDSMPIIAYYDSRRSSYTKGFDTLEQAALWLSQEEHLGELAATGIDVGGRTIEGDELRNLMWDQPVYDREDLEP